MAAFWCLLPQSPGQVPGLAEVLKYFTFDFIKTSTSSPDLTCGGP